METKAEAAPGGSWWERRSRHWPAVAGLLVAHFLLLFFSVQQVAATSDEPYHIARGVAALYSHGDFRLSVAHPPLLNVINALPLLFLPEINLPFADAAWQSTTMDSTAARQRFASLLLWKINTPQTNPWMTGLDIIHYCRIPTMVLSVGLGLAIFLWTRRRLGPGPGLAGLVLYCFSPTVLAHGGLVTTDLGVALLIFAFAIALHRLLERKSWSALALCGACFGLAQLGKYTAVLLIPLIPVIFLLEAEGTLGRRLKNFLDPRPSRPGFFQSGVAWLIILAIGMVVIWAGFLFETHSLHQIQVPDPVAFAAKPGAFLKRLVVIVVGRLHLVPPTYYHGFTRTLIDTAEHSYPLYFLGQSSETGWWYYYPVMFAIKEPISLLALLVLAAAARTGKPLPRRLLNIGLVHVIGLSLFFMFLNAKNIGLRHLLPIYPFIFVLAAGQFDWQKVRSPLARYGGIALLAAYGLNAFISYPDYLVHFNRLVGGPDGGLKRSVVGEDWGQDLPALARFMAEERLPRITYLHYGNAEPEAYGINYQKFSCQDLGPGYYAFHVVDLRRPRQEAHEQCLDRFLAMTPTKVLNHTIFVYKLEQSSE